MKKSILSLIVALSGFSGFSATFTINNSGTTFTPNEITIAVGDNVNFVIGNSHNAVEVSQATYNSNGNAPLPGGFSVPFGGGAVPAEKLTAGIHYYVCEPHAEFGMKGKITVLNTTGIAENKLKDGISIFPNPSNGNFQLKINNPQTAKDYELGIYNVLGARVYSKSQIQQQSTINVDIADLPKGTYFVKLFSAKETFYRKIVVR
jgi:plastocyanin